MQRERAAATCTLLIESCDCRQDLWSPCMRLLNRFWPDRPFRTILLTEVLEPHFEGVACLPIGAGTAWSTQVLMALDAISTPYVINLLDDFFLHNLVDTQRVLELLDWVEERDANLLRLYPNPGPDSIVVGGPGVGVLHPRAGFLTSTQVGIWKVDWLRSMLRPSEGPWEFERLGSERARSSSGLYATREPVIDYEEVVVQGRWWRDHARTYQLLDVGCDFDARPLISRSTHITRRLKQGMSRLGNHVVRVCLPDEFRYLLLEFLRRRGFRV